MSKINSRSSPPRFALLMVGLVAVFALVRPVQAPQTAGVEARPSVAAARLGTNLRDVMDWSTQRPFLDLIKQARAWFTQCDPERDADCDGGWETGEARELDVDEQGWVRSLPAPAAPGYSIAATVLHQPDSLRAGRYVMRYAGTGEIRYRLGARRIDSASRPGRDVLDIDPARGAIHIQIYATDPAGSGDYLRDLQLVRQDREPLLLAGQHFDPDFLRRIGPFQALRFMEWMKTNGSPLEQWIQRPLPDDALYTLSAGVPAERMIELANALGAAPWFTLPHRADDDLMRQFARLARDTLAPSLKVYVEYSNEVWNASFAQHGWVAEQARALWPGGKHSALAKTINWYGKRSAELCDIWKQVFANAEERVVCVMGGQAANAWIATQALDCRLWSAGKPCSSHGIDAIAIAPYFGGYLGDPSHESRLADWASAGEEGLERLFLELEHGGLLPDGPEGGALAQAMRWVDQHVALGNRLGLPVLAYEGGQHLVGLRGAATAPAVSDFFIRANRDPRMGQLYRAYLGAWGDHSGGLLMHFSDIGTPTMHGSWGALEDVTQVWSPKFGALIQFLSSSDLLR